MKFFSDDRCGVGGGGASTAIETMRQSLQLEPIGEEIVGKMEDKRELARLRRVVLVAPPRGAATPSHFRVRVHRAVESVAFQPVRQMGHA